MKLTPALIAAVCLLSLPAFAQSPVTLYVNTQSLRNPIPRDFVGISMFTGTQVRDHRDVSGNLFSGTNTQLITLFKNAGLHHLRLGATGSSSAGTQNLTHEDIDSLFAFAKATDIKVIYSLHGEEAATTAKYVWDNYRPYLDCFAFDNEPDGHLDKPTANASNYFADWRYVANVVTSAVPAAKFAGPDASGRALVPRFIKQESDTGCLALITQHVYVGGNPIKHHIDLPHAIDAMLSPEWLTEKYPGLYDQALRPAVKANLPFRLTESDDYVHGVTNASDAFAAALWALDYTHWWAARGAAGVNFQNTEWIPTDTFYRDAEGNYQIHPKAYGLRAFDEANHGSIKIVAVTNPGKLNLTAYAIGNPTNLFVTIINKEHGPGARDASVTIVAKNFGATNVSALFLTAPNNDLTATHGITLGGATITNNASWTGQWTALKPAPDGQYTVHIHSSSAAVVKLSL
jgi:hypothetical protein